MHLPTLALPMLALAAALVASPPTHAQDFPTRPLRMVVPFAVGGTSDILTRLVAPKMWEALGQPVVADNRPGAGSNVGNEIVAKASPDGYTLLLATPAIASNLALYGKLRYDPIRELAPVTLLAEIPVILVVHPSLTARNAGELVALAKSQPGKFNFGSSGNGGIGHLVGELFKSMTGVQMVHVPYKGNGPALIDLMGGVLNLAFSDMSGALPHVKSGKLRALGIATSARNAALPDVPPITETGVPGFQAASWFAVFATGGTPKASIDKLHGVLVNVLRAPDIRQRFNDLGIDPIGNTPREMGAFLASETAKWTRVVKDSGARID